MARVSIKSYNKPHSRSRGKGWYEHQIYMSSIDRKVAPKHRKAALKDSGCRSRYGSITSAQIRKKMAGRSKRSQLVNRSSGCPTDRIYDRNKKVCMSPQQNLKPMMGWPGGKSRVSKEIVSKIPEHDTYVEPMVGGGSVFFQKELAHKNIINDKNKNLINYYKQMAKTSPQKTKGCLFPSRKHWKRIKNKRDGGKPLSACEFRQLVAGSYGCKTDSWGYKPKKTGTQLGQNVNKNLDHYQYKLKNTKMLEQDYQKVTEKYDGKNVFFYLDPPYHEAIDYNQPTIDPNDIAKTYKNSNGKVMISYNDHPVVRNAFPKKDGWKYDYIYLPYTLQKPKNGIGRQPTKELLITNY